MCIICEGKFMCCVYVCLYKVCGRVNSWYVCECASMQEGKVAAGLREIEAVRNCVGMKWTVCSLMILVSLEFIEYLI